MPLPSVTVTIWPAAMPVEHFGRRPFGQRISSRSICLRGAEAEVHAQVVLRQVARARLHLAHLRRGADGGAHAGADRAAVAARCRRAGRSRRWRRPRRRCAAGRRGRCCSPPADRGRRRCRCRRRRARGRRARRRIPGPPRRPCRGSGRRRCAAARGAAPPWRPDARGPGCSSRGRSPPTGRDRRRCRSRRTACRSRRRAAWPGRRRSETVTSSNRPLPRLWKSVCPSNSWLVTKMSSRPSPS